MSESQVIPSQFQGRVLLVDDQPMIVEAVRRMLANQPEIEFHYVTDPAQALDTARRLKPTVILQDLVMPAADGFDLLAQYRADPVLADVPVIVLSSKDESATKVKAFSLGAHDYMVKLPDQMELQARLRYHSHSRIHRLERDEAFRFLRESQQKLAEANLELQKLAALDPLTGIANRRRFDEALQVEWLRGARDKHHVALLMCDVDCFKAYNDTFGHVEGDFCLKKAAAVLTESVRRPADLPARYGGEEFALILPETDLTGAMQVAETCRVHLEQLQLPNPGSSAGSIVTMSIGVAAFVPSIDTSPEELVRAADKALYTSKTSGRNRATAA